MTRDDAVKKAEECFQFNVPGQEWFFTPLRLVAALENLGLLKFEEPKAPKTREQLIAKACSIGGIKTKEWSKVERGLAAAGLPADNSAEMLDSIKKLMDQVESLRETLSSVMGQSEHDLKSAHAEICKLQGLDPSKHTWPAWSPQMNSLHWFGTIREKFGLALFEDDG